MPDVLPSGRWRGRIRHPATGLQISAHTIIGGQKTYEDERTAIAAEVGALAALTAAGFDVTVRDFWNDWTTRAPWLRPSESTNIHNYERTYQFVKRYGKRPIRAIDDTVAVEWLANGKNTGTVPSLRAFFNDAMTAQAGRLVARNPFAKLGLKQSKGRKNIQPPSEVDAGRLIELADELTPPSFAAYLHFAIHQGTRPGEGDGLRVDRLSLDTGCTGEILIDQQWNAKSRTMTLPKHHYIRTIALTEPARERLLTLPLDGEFVFQTLRGMHYTPSARQLHWNRVRCAAGLGNLSLYTCTRHYFAWYAWNVLDLSPEDIAHHFGHQDGGDLVRKLYGHFDGKLSRDKVSKAFQHGAALQPDASQVRRLRLVSDEDERAVS